MGYETIPIVVTASAVISSCATSNPELAPAPAVDFTEINPALTKAMVDHSYFHGQVRLGAENLSLGDTVSVESVNASVAKVPHDKNSSRWPVTIKVNTLKDKMVHSFQWNCQIDSTDEAYSEAIQGCLPNSYPGPLMTVDPLVNYRKSKWLPDLKIMKPVVGMPWSVVKDVLKPIDCSQHESHTGKTQYCTAGLGYRIILTDNVVTSSLPPEH